MSTPTPTPALEARRRRTRIRPALLAATALAVIVAACSGSGSASQAARRERRSQRRRRGRPRARRAQDRLRDLLAALARAQASMGWLEKALPGTDGRPGSTRPARATRSTSSRATPSTSARPQARPRCWPRQRQPDQDRLHLRAARVDRARRRQGLDDHGPEGAEGQEGRRPEGHRPLLLPPAHAGGQRPDARPTSSSSTCRTPTAGPPSSAARSTRGPGSIRTWPRASSQAGSKLIYRNKDFNTYGFLNGREEFVEKYPETTKKLIAALRAGASSGSSTTPTRPPRSSPTRRKLPLDVAKRELEERMNFKVSGIPGDAHIAVLNAVVPIIESRAAGRGRRRRRKGGHRPDRRQATRSEVIK